MFAYETQEDTLTWKTLPLKNYLLKLQGNHNFTGHHSVGILCWSVVNLLNTPIINPLKQKHHLLYSSYTAALLCYSIRFAQEFNRIIWYAFLNSTFSLGVTMKVW